MSNKSSRESFQVWKMRGLRVDTKRDAGYRLTTFDDCTEDAQMGILPYQRVLKLKISDSERSRNRARHSDL